MKRSEFAEIVNAVAHEELGKLNDTIRHISSKNGENSENAVAIIMGEIAASIPAIAARTTAEVLIRSGLLQLEDEQ